MSWLVVLDQTTNKIMTCRCFHNLEFTSTYEKPSHDGHITSTQEEDTWTHMTLWPSSILVITKHRPLIKVNCRNDPHANVDIWSLWSYNEVFNEGGGGYS